MNPASLALLADEVTRVRFQLGRIQSNADWILPVAVASLLMLFARWMYRRDAEELHPALGWLLTGLRTAAILGLLVLYLQPQWRVEREVVHNSRAVVLVDRSLSMGLSDVDASGSPQAATRAQQVAKGLAHSDFLKRLRATHDVVVIGFDEAVTRIASLGKIKADSTGQEVEGQETESASASGAGEASIESRADIGAGASGSLSATADSKGGQAAHGTPNDKIGDKIDWDKAIQPQGNETRLGGALKQVISDERSSPLAGVIVITDGGQNAGVPPETAIELANEAKVPIYPVGVGSTQRPANVGIYELEAPERAHPGDPYTVTGLIQSEGLTGQTVSVQLTVRDPAKGTDEVVQTEQVTLGRDGDPVPVKFQVTPKETGRRQIVLKVTPPRTDRNPADDRREAEIEIVDRKNHVLLFAGGPSREYQFLKSLLYRDKSTRVDVLLQTGSEGISQEAAKILDQFPSTREAMFDYDCVVAFDPKWQALGPEQVNLVEDWVGEQGGGLVVIPGPVYAGQAINGWVQDAAMAKIRALYPVEFHRRVSIVDAEAYTARDPWPLDFSREGRDAQFLWLEDGESANQQAWSRFPGVYGYYPVRGVKDGATVYARFSDPQAAQGDKQPIYMAGQFYGSGRVFYLGSGEMWRLRRANEKYFEQFYTRLIRHVSQGRLLRQSSRGSLMVDRDRYLLGATATIRAQLTNARLEPLTTPSVALEVVQPDRNVQAITLRPDPNRAGMFTGQLTLLQEGAYRLELAVPESDNERLKRQLQVRIPNLERENPQRNDALLTRIADATGGRYYRDLNAAFSDSVDPVADQLKDRTKTSILTAAPNLLWERKWLGWAMLGLCGVLCVEWLIRRLLKLA